MTISNNGFDNWTKGSQLGFEKANRVEDRLIAMFTKPCSVCSLKPPSPSSSSHLPSLYYTMPMPYNHPTTLFILPTQVHNTNTLLY